VNTVLKEQKLTNGQTIQIVQGDITTEDVEVIVNAANEHLQHGGGVARAISRRGGRTIQHESNGWTWTKGKVDHVHPAWTSGGQLLAKYVIHAVGPVWGDPRGTGTGGDEDAKLVAAVSGSLRVADELGLKSIAFPTISTGIFGFPKERAAKIIFNTIETYFKENSTSGVEMIKLVLFNQAAVNAFLKV